MTKSNLDKAKVELTDSLRRDDLREFFGRLPHKPAKLRKPRIMWAVVAEGKDLGAYLTRKKAQEVADLLPDAYVTACTRSPTEKKQRYYTTRIRATPA